ncbi:NADH-cytochrome b5 reductase-like protein, partial [Actinidia chinensis var. chinensis]
IAGGTGITPMLQVIDAIIRNSDDNTQVLYANVSPDDILLKHKLDMLAASYPNLKDWNGGSGYITKDMVVKGLPSPSDDALILILSINHANPMAGLGNHMQTGPGSGIWGKKAV